LDDLFSQPPRHLSAERHLPMSDAAPLHQTPLHALHLELGARMVPFAGYAMPVQYPPA
jgi:aminomethyltransferase